MTDYLLGEMPEAERADFEIRYLTDDSLFEQMLMVKQELIDAYVREQLDAQTREKFEQHFLATPEGQKEVAFARALREKLNEPAMRPIQTPARRWPAWFGAGPVRQIGFATASLLLMIGAGWLFLENRKLRRELVAVQNERIELARREEALRQQIAQLTAPTPTPAPREETPAPTVELLAINLLPASRSGETNLFTVKLPARPRRPSLNLKLNFEPLGLRCRVGLQTPDGQSYERRNLPVRPHRQGGFYVQANFPNLKLTPGLYEATVTGRDADDNEPREVSYRFRVEPFGK